MNVLCAVNSLDVLYLYQMRNLYLLVVFAGNAEQGHSIILDYEFTFLERGNLSLYIIEVLACHTEDVLNHGVIYALLLHDERVLGIGIEIKMLALETVHILSRQDDAQPLVSTDSDKIAKRLVIKVKHIVRLVYDCEMPDLYAFVVDSLLLQLLIYVVQFRNYEIDYCLGDDTILRETVHLDYVTAIDKVNFVFCLKQIVSNQLLENR